jgi:eukaryotic-like serine/threonine-protein kinase
MPGSPPAGWYPDPDDPELARYWDGSSWTGFTEPRGAPGGTPTLPPGPIPPPQGDAPPPTINPPKKLSGVAWVAFGVLSLAIAVNVMLVIASLDYADKVQTQIDTHALTYQQAVDAEDSFEIAGILYLISVIAGAIGFLVWWYRAYSNVPGLTQQRLRFGRGWSIGAWFVPILSLWRPKQIGNDIWRAGDPAASGNPKWTSLPVSQLVHWWWAVFLLAGFLDAVAAALLSTDPVLSNSVSAPDLLPAAHAPTHADLQQEHTAAVADAASSAIEVIAAIAAIVFVKAASDRQDAHLAGPGRSEGAA